MKLLLDTHIWLWSLLSPERLVPRVATEIASPANELWLSPISVWEAMLLVQRGRLVVGSSPRVWIEDMLRATPQREAPVNHEVAVWSRLLELSHPDPADRFLAATAKVYDLTLVTADDRLQQSSDWAVLPNH